MASLPGRLGSLIASDVMTRQIITVHSAFFGFRTVAFLM